MFFSFIKPHIQQYIKISTLTSRVLIHCKNKIYVVSYQTALKIPEDIMDEANTGQRSAILLDIENHLFGGLRDRDITLSLSDLTRLIAEDLEKTAASQHPVEYKYAAISLIPDDADKKIRNRRKDVWTVIRTIADMGLDR